MKQKRTYRTWLAASALVVMVLTLAASGDSVRLTWDASPAAGIAGYRVYYGTNSGAYGFVTNAGLTLTQTVVLPRRGRWFFAATVYDTNLLESCFSNEVQWEAKPAAPVMQGEKCVRVAPLIERSTNQTNWSAVAGEPTFFAATNGAEWFRTSRLTIENMTRVGQQ